MHRKHRTHEVNPQQEPKEAQAGVQTPGRRGSEDIDATDAQKCCIETRSWSPSVLGVPVPLTSYLSRFISLWAIDSHRERVVNHHSAHVAFTECLGVTVSTTSWGTQLSESFLRSRFTRKPLSDVHATKIMCGILASRRLTHSYHEVPACVTVAKPSGTREAPRCTG